MYVKSTNKAIVVPVNLEPHPNADSLSVVHVDGYTVVCRTDDWKDQDRGIFVPIENKIDTRRPEFSFLARDGKSYMQTVKTVKLRGVFSQGLLVPAPHESQIGDDLTDFLEIIHVDDESDLDTDYVDTESHIFYNAPKYDIDSFLKYSDNFILDEPIVITEKIHGANAKFVYTDGKIKVGSRGQWKINRPDCQFWQGFKSDPHIEVFLRSNPNLLLRGEIYGFQAKGGIRFRYDQDIGKVGFVAFDIMRQDNTYLDYYDGRDLCEEYNVPVVPHLYTSRYQSLGRCQEFAEGMSQLGKRHLREGCVIRPLTERKDDKFNRVIYKIIGNGYSNL